MFKENVDKVVEKLLKIFVDSWGLFEYYHFRGSGISPKKQMAICFKSQKQTEYCIVSVGRSGIFYVLKLIPF